MHNEVMQGMVDHGNGVIRTMHSPDEDCAWKSLGTQRMPLDLHHCLNRCGIMRIGKGYCYACQRLFAPVGLAVVPTPHPNELAGRAPVLAESAPPGDEGGKRLWDTLPRVTVGVASHLPFLGSPGGRRGNRAPSQLARVPCGSSHRRRRINRVAIELKSFAIGCGLCLLALFCCLAAIRAYLAVYGLTEFGK